MDQMDRSEIVAWICGAALVATLLTFIITGISTGVHYARDQESACAAAGGQLMHVTPASQYDGCYKVTVTYTPLEMPDVRRRP